VALGGCSGCARAAFWLTAALAARAPSYAMAGAPSTRVSVKPGMGDPRATVVLSLRIPQTTGRFASVTRRDVLSVSGPRLAGCVSRVTVTLRAGRRGTRRTVTLNPKRLGGAWCAGEFGDASCSTRFCAAPLDRPRCAPIF